MGGQGLDQVKILRIAIFPDLLGCFLHGFYCQGGGAKDILVCPQPGGIGLATAALLGFGADKGHGGGQGLGKRGIARRFHAVEIAQIALLQQGLHGGATQSRMP